MPPGAASATRRAAVPAGLSLVPMKYDCVTDMAQVVASIQ